MESLKASSSAEQYHKRLLSDETNFGNGSLLHTELKSEWPDQHDHRKSRQHPLKKFLQKGMYNQEATIEEEGSSPLKGK